MSPALPAAAAAFLTLALSGAALVQAAETESEKLLDQATFAESEDSTQVKEEKAVEKKDGMDAPAPAAGTEAKDAAKDAAKPAAVRK